MPSIKNIAIPPKRAARRASSAADDTEAAISLPPAALRRPPRAVQAAPSHRYRVGERLRMGHGGQAITRAAAHCRVLALLPYEGRGALLYRVRSETEAFERIVSEGDLSRLELGD